MPEILRNLLRNISDEQAEKVWLWFDGNPDAVHETIEYLLTTHPALVAKCSQGESA